MAFVKIGMDGFFVDLTPLNLLLRHELRFRTSIVAKELFNLSCIVNFFAFKHGEIKSRKSRSRKEESISPLREIIFLANKELKGIFALLELDSDIEYGGLCEIFFRCYERIVLINNKLENTLKLLSFLQKKIKYILEATPPYSPAPTIFRDRQESKFYEALEKIVDYTFSCLGVKDTKVSIYWETNIENTFLDLDVFSDQDEINFLFEGSFFIVNQPSMWPLVIHESVHYYLNKFCFKKVVKSSLKDIRKCIDKICYEIYGLVNRYNYSATFIRNIIIDCFVDSVLTILLGPLYILLLWRILFAYDETCYHLCIPLKRAWYIRLLIPILIYKNLKQQNIVPLLKIKKNSCLFKRESLFNIFKFDLMIDNFVETLKKLQEVYIKNCYRPDQADMRKYIEEYISSRVAEKFLKLFKEQKEKLQQISQKIEEDFFSLQNLFSFENYDYKNNNLNKFTLLNLTLSQYVNEKLLSASNNIDEPLCEGRINTLFYKIIRDISDCRDEKKKEIFDLMNVVPNRKISAQQGFLINLCKKLKDLPVILLSFIKFRSDSDIDWNILTQFIEEFKTNNSAHFWFYDLGAFNLVAADINFRDKYAGKSIITNYIEKIIINNKNKNSKLDPKESTLSLWHPLIENRVPFYKYDITLTPIKIFSQISKKQKLEQKKINIETKETKINSIKTLKEFFEKCYEGANLLLQISNDCISIRQFIDQVVVSNLLKILNSPDKNVRENPILDSEEPLMEILVCVAFNWANYILLINLPKTIAKDNFGNYFVEFKKSLIAQYEKIGRSKTDILAGLKLPRETSIPSPEILLRLSSDAQNINQNINVLHQEIGHDWSIYLRPGNFDLLLRNTQKEVISFGKLLRAFQALKRLNPSDVQLRFSLTF